MAYSSRSATVRTPPKPLDDEQLRRIALTYVGRYATTRSRLSRYLERKIYERGWAGGSEADIVALVSEFAALSYVDDDAFARSKSSSLLRRGYGPLRIKAALHGAGIDSEEIGKHVALDEETALAAALDFVRRRRLVSNDRVDDPHKKRAKALAAMIRAGHHFHVAQKALAIAEENDTNSGG
jgi:regulatory protein